MWPHRSVRTGCWLTVLILIALGVITVVVRSCIPNKAAAPFTGMKEQAQAVCSGSVQTKPKSSMPYRIGKVLAVRSEGDPIGHIMENGQLQDIVAVSPEEVGTLICVGDTILNEVDPSTTHAAAYQLTREITVIDWATNDVIYRITLKGSLPPTPTNKVDATAGTDPEYSLLVDFIAHLPQK